MVWDAVQRDQAVGFYAVLWEARHFDPFKLNAFALTLTVVWSAPLIDFVLGVGMLEERSRFGILALSLASILGLVLGGICFWVNSAGS